MAHAPLFEESIASATAALIDDFDQLAPVIGKKPGEFEALLGLASGRRLSVYPPSAVFDLTDELEHLSRRAIEPNVFFNPRFLAPAISRLEDKDIKLAILRDETTGKEKSEERLRMVAPFSIEKPSFGVGPSIMRVWGNEFGPRGAPLIDGDDPFATVDEFLSIISRPHLNLPQVLVVPHSYTDGPATELMRAAALAQGFPAYTVNAVERAVLDTTLDGEAYINSVFSAHHRRGYRRLWRRVEEKHGKMTFNVTRRRDDLFMRAEEFLALEASGWKGQKRSALISDKLQAAFARESLDKLAEGDHLRIYTLDIAGKAVASLLVIIENGVSYTWKIAYNEDFHEFSPGMLLMIEATKQNLKDPNISWSDSCAVPDHPMMNRVWSERREIATLVIGLGHGSDDAARRVQSQLHLYDQTRSAARGMRNSLKRFIKKLNFYNL